MFKPKKNYTKKKLPTYILNINSYALPPPLLPFARAGDRRKVFFYYYYFLFIF